VQDCWNAPRRLATALIRLVGAIGNAIATSSGPNALVTADALERVQILLAWPQVVLVFLALVILDVVFIDDRVDSCATDARTRRRAPSPALIRQSREIRAKTLRVDNAIVDI
jgi:hypothetical protein